MELALARYNKHMKRGYHEIVLTGASASGKTTALAYLTQKLGDRGITVLACPETATVMLAAGLGDVPAARQQEPERFLQLQKSILMLQHQLRSHMRAQAEAVQGPTVILYDRAEMDVLAYVGQEMFAELLQDQGLNVTELRDQYHAVIHLVSVAVDYPEFYNNHNNPARWDDAENARHTNGLLLRAWTGAPHLWVVDNQERLEGKLERTLDIVLHTLGLPQPIEHEHKFLLHDAPNTEELIQRGAQAIDITQYYIQGESGEFRLRERSQGGVATFYHTVKEALGDGSCMEHESRISRQEYYRSLDEYGGSCRVLSKKRWCFAESGHYYELDQINNTWLLEVETLPDDSKPVVPQWLGRVEDVTGDTRYSSSELSKKAQN